MSSKDTFGKKEREKKKRSKQKEKEEKRNFRKLNNDKGKNLHEMLMFVDANGNLTETPPETEWIRDLHNSNPDRDPNASPDAPMPVTKRSGTVTFFDAEKGFGFIEDHATKQSIYVNKRHITEDLERGATVHFLVQRNSKGTYAVDVE